MLTRRLIIFKEQIIKQPGIQDSQLSLRKLKGESKVRERQLQDATLQSILVYKLSDEP
jgi:hypothetical protein